MSQEKVPVPDSLKRLMRIVVRPIHDRLVVSAALTVAADPEIDRCVATLAGWVSVCLAEMASKNAPSETERQRLKEELMEALIENGMTPIPMPGP